MADKSAKNSTPPEEVKSASGNSAQARKDQKRREAELRIQTQPLRKKTEQLEKRMTVLQTTLSENEQLLSQPGIYEQERKTELTAALKIQAESQSELEECEMEWLELQEQLETISSAAS